MEEKGFKQYADSDSDPDYSSSSSDDYIEESDSETLTYTRPGEAPPETVNTPETNIRRYTRVLESKRIKRIQEEEDEDYVYIEDLWDFPPDPENWREEDLKEYWVDAPLEMTKPGWDPVWADEEDWEIVRDEIKEGRDPGIAPFYVPYRKPYPAIPDNHYDISNPKAVIEELDRIEEFLNWVSYIFPDGSSYEGTVWDDLAHGKGVYVAEQGLVRYEGEWLQNNMEGHGVVEVDIPDIEPVPGSKFHNLSNGFINDTTKLEFSHFARLEAKLRAEGKIISRDFMTPEDREWLEMDVEDSIRLADGQYEIPFYESDIWIKHFGRKPYISQFVALLRQTFLFQGEGSIPLCWPVEAWQNAWMCYSASVNHANQCSSLCYIDHGCRALLKEERGPYGDPQHPYFYEEEDVWMAPGFIKQFYEVPDYWKTYVHEVDQEREMWLNSFYKAPLRLPMPAELEYWWSKDETPEFVLINKEPEPDPEDPSKLIYTEDPLILHTPTGRLINYIEDEEHGVRLFWQPPVKEGEEIDPKKAKFLPLGFDEFYGREVIQKRDNIWKRLITAIENALKPGFDKLEKWTEEKKKAGELKMKLIEKELDLIEAELLVSAGRFYFGELLEDLDGCDENISAMHAGIAEVAAAKARMFVNKPDGMVREERGPYGDPQHPYFYEEEDVWMAPGFINQFYELVSVVPSTLRESILALKQRRLPLKSHPSSSVESASDSLKTTDSVSFPLVLGHKGRLRAFKQDHQKYQPQNQSSGKKSQLHSLCKILSCPSTTTRSRVRQPGNLNRYELHAAPKKYSDSILSLHIPVCYLESYTDTKRHGASL
ncbi:hypothetical protein GOBAR_DD14640 [Gossypium barbadense]|nr:hypothetical protein GOBAR_DD14640 [Gossypium barbadense]